MNFCPDTFARTLRQLSVYVFVCWTVVGAMLIAPHVTHAANGQCRWEGGPGAPTYPTCELEDCVSAGGQAQCADPTPTPWKFEACLDDYRSNAKQIMCEAIGGTYTSGVCSNVPEIDDGQWPGIYDTVHQRQNAAWSGVTCPSHTDTGWTTATVSGYWCAASISYAEKNGMPISGGRILNSENCPTGAIGTRIIAKRDRQLLCPTGFAKRTLPNGYMACFQAACPPGKEWAPEALACVPVVDVDRRSKDVDRCCKEGNPIYPMLGSKREVIETGIELGGLPLELSYDTTRAPWTAAGAPPPPGNLTGALGNLWWSSFHRRFHGNSFNVYFQYVTRGDGRLLTLTPNASNNGWIMDGDITDGLNFQSGGGYRFRDRRGSGFEWFQGGPLKERQSAGGMKLTFTYSTATTPPSIAPGVNYLLGVSDPFGHAISFTYQTLATGVVAIKTAVDQASNSIEFSYDTNGNLEDITWPDGTVRHFHYENAALPWALTGVTDEAVRRYSTFAYDAQGRASSTELADGVNRYAVSYETPPGIAVTRTYDSARKWIWRYRDWTAPVGSIVTVPNGSSKSLDGSIIAGLPTMTSRTRAGSSVAANYDYDANGNVIRYIDYRGLQTCRSYVAGRNLVAVSLEGRPAAEGCPADLVGYTVPAGTAQRKTTSQWHPLWNFKTREARAGVITTWVYNGQPDPTAGNATVNCAPSSATLLDGSRIAVLCKKVEQPTTDDSGTLGFAATAIGTARISTYAYDAYGRVLTANGPRTDVNDTTTYTYYTCTTGFQCGQVATVRDPLGHVTTYHTYNAYGKPLTYSDPNGVMTTLAYDLRQRLTSITVGSETTTFEYWATGLLRRTTLPDGSHLQYTYDAAHRLTDIEDSEGNRIHYTLDVMGNRTAEESFDPLSTLTQTRTRVFDTLNQLWQEIGAAGTSAVTTEYAYDDNGNQTVINAPMGRSTTQGYDELNRLTSVTDAASGVTTYGYNALDQLISVTDPRNKVTSYTYNALGDLKEQVSPETGTTTNMYDSGGNLQTRTDARGKIATYSYDALNRVTQLSYPDQTIGYSYDQGTNGIGRLTSVSDGSGSTAWTYDAQGRTTSKQSTIGAINLSIAYGYSTSGQLQTLTLPSGNYITYGYSNGKISSLTLNGSTTLLSNVLYQPFGPTNGWMWGNSTLAVREYDTDGKVTDIDSAGLKSYFYDDAFRITSISDAADPNLTQSYGYDLLDRLTSATGASLNQGWTYDANGNRLTETGSTPSTFTISSTSNRLSAISGSINRSYGYDAAGNITSDGTRTFTYDDAGRMVSATKAGVTAAYSINALGQRVRKTISGSSTYFAYDEAGHLVGEYGSSGNLIQETVWFGDIPVATLRSNGGGGVNLFYVHTDHLNTPRRITRPSDNVVVWRWDSDPFGITLSNEDPDGDSIQFAYNLRFPGQYYDTETGLSYNYFRDYDPATGRYVESDPIGLDGGLNTYSYVFATPPSLIDPDGLQVIAPYPTTGPVVGGAAGSMTSEMSGPLTELLNAAGEAVQNTQFCCRSYTNVYEPNDGKHGRIPRAGPRGEISRLPFDGQGTLNTSVPAGPETRIGHDPFNGELVIFQQHGVLEYPKCIKFWHGYVVTVRDLTPQQWRAGRDAGFPKWPRKPR